MQTLTRGVARLHDCAARCCAIALLLVVSACGGGGNDGDSISASGTETRTSDAGGSEANAAVLADNEVRITVDGGPDGNSVNSPFVEVTVCSPGGSDCQTIDHVLLDTGSYGLRIVASALGSRLSALPPVKAPDGNPLAECAGFVSGYTWGSVRTAEVRMASETARKLPIQVVNDPGAGYATVPDECSSTGVDVGATFGAKAILGVGFKTQDCGVDCVASTAPGMYFSCTRTACTSTVVPLASQVTNPLARFAVHNNGVAIRLPAVPTGGVDSLSGTLVLGIGTASNNRVAREQVFTANENGHFTTVYRGRTMSGFLDSGSNGMFFRDRSIPSCASGFYCPSDTLSLSASVRGADGKASRKIDFLVESTAGLSAADVAAHLGGDWGSAAYFDWGLPFFYGRTVFVALGGASTPYGTGPFWAF
jgi:hypothetical protein